jgi:hypothetical protein
MQHCVGRLDRYEGAGPPVSHERRVSYHRPSGQIEVVDCIEGRGRHALALHWHLAPGVRAALDGHQVRLGLPGHELLMDLPGQGWAELLHACDDDPQAWVSTRYERREPSTVIRVTFQRTGLPARLATRIRILQSEGSTPPVQGDVIRVTPHDNPARAHAHGTTG